MAARGPRIGRPDRIAALAAQLEAEGALGLPPGWPAVTRMLVDTPPKAPTGAARKAVLEAAEQLAEMLQPLPSALHELSTRINRHCANTGRDAELAHAVDLMSGRTFDLFLAIQRLRDAGVAKESRPRPEGRGAEIEPPG